MAPGIYTEIWWVMDDKEVEQQLKHCDHIKEKNKINTANIKSSYDS